MRCRNSSGSRHGKTVMSEFGDRKSTRLNSSHQIISYAVFCLKKKKKNRGNNEESKDDTELRFEKEHHQYRRPRYLIRGNTLRRDITRHRHVPGDRMNGVCPV